MIYFMRPLTNGDVYVGFPDKTDPYVEPMPDDVKWWVSETIEEPLWQRDGWKRRRGVYLKPEDAVVFKLKFG